MLFCKSAPQKRIWWCSSPVPYTKYPTIREITPTTISPMDQVLMPDGISNRSLMVIPNDFLRSIFYLLSNLSDFLLQHGPLPVCSLYMIPPSSAAGCQAGKHSCPSYSFHRWQHRTSDPRVWLRFSNLLPGWPVWPDKVLRRRGTGD